MNIAVFASHGGSDLQAIIDGCKSGQIDAQVAVVISNNADSFYGIKESRKGKYTTLSFECKNVRNRRSFGKRNIKNFGTI